MRKITFLFFAIALITFKAAAQDSKIKFGLQGGLNYSSLRGNDSYSDDTPGFSYLFGVSFQYKIKDNLSLKADLNYERKTQVSKEVIEILDNPNMFYGVYHFKNTTYQNYIMLPILLKYNFTRSKSFYINGGPFLGYLLKSGTSTDLSLPGMNSDDTDDTKYRKSLDYGIVAGIGKEFKLSDNNQIYIEIRENLGLANMAKTEVTYLNNIKTNALNLIIGYNFN
ncbi:PorT family protein [Flavobacterium cupreum]|uniref:PorT family protein n=1 Tax=Flavobacterium cupreum TaxID=2133766 RepID=A0A434A6I5_9FLAO|nr:porin family protein [Flavobacterium cupreum]RUT69946.1 PorT family protein [Flavobacterium cupreum]